MLATDRSLSSDERFSTPRASARTGGYTSSSGDELWATPRNTTARSQLSDDYGTPRDVWGVGDDSPGYYSSRPQRAESKYGEGYEYYNETQTAPSKQAMGGGYTINMQDKYEEYGYVAAEEGTYYSETHKEELSDPTTPIGISDPDIEDIFSFARHNRSHELEGLLDKGVPVDVRDHHGNTVLSIACQNGLKRIAKIALRHGADLNTTNFRGNTPLHFCYKYGYGHSLGVYLLSKGADPTPRNNDGQTCYEVEGLTTPRH